MSLNEAVPSHGSEDLYRMGHLRRTTLVSLRWMAIIGQLIALAVVWLVLKFDLPLLACLTFIGISAVLNTLIMIRAPLDRRITNMEAGTQLFFDILQISTLLYLTGGMKNPFALLLIAPVIVSVKTLNRGVFAGLATSVAIISFLLLFYHRPLPWYPGEFLDLPNYYLYGFWIALLVGMMFTSLYTWQATSQTRRMTEAFAASEAILSHEKKLAALGGLAAAAAHELGTPLATIQVVAKEIAREAETNSELKEDADLLLSQAIRCRDILQQLADRGDSGDEVHDRLDISALIREITEPFIGFGPEIITRLNPPNESADIPVLKRQQEFVYGLTNIVENAVDFAKSKVHVDATWSNTHIAIEVLDDGPGFNHSIFHRLGEPYISMRQHTKNDASQISGGGLGLGVFIAKTLIERLGGSVSFENRKNVAGAKVNLIWPYTQ
ncbi:MAG: ActS/PrrB/RegB family redox-sensitive histidine kinase [Acidimicrobiales bacterium]|nr:ActS/PrrB/RegB family redox-sensitive histidine kinase [Hyphomonadaceae bacterium]RZV43819.1 MAG: ActS/PrrB/RegB family redox-sensitive histidine kinase [Acidimicrobiales bacterium]